jgi:hypothetical protein
MKTELRIREVTLAGAVLLGVLADVLVRVEGRPGINVFIWALAGTAVLWLSSRQRPTPVSTETKWLVGSALAFSALLMLRDAEALAAFCLFSCVVLLGHAAGRAAMAWARTAYITDVAAAALRVAAFIALGPLGWSIGSAREPAPSKSRVRTLARGTVMAVPPLIILSTLLSSADPIFEQVLFANIKPALEHIAFAGVVAWFASGYMRAFMVRDDVVERVAIPRIKIAPSEITVALSLIVVLFVVFLIVQVRYLFGGADLIQVTAGLTYSEYARRGFFEMVAAAAFLVPVLLIADWCASDDDARGKRIVHATSTLIVLLLAGILGSAAYRMKLYQDAYGLTEDRLYGSFFMIWLAAVLTWLAFTVLRGKRRGFAFGAVLAGLACLVVLHVVNPHALIARVNIARAMSGAEYDGRYLTSLSADAVPTLVDRLAGLPREERCRVSSVLVKNWSGHRQGGWRTWNLSDARARRIVANLQIAPECAAAQQQAGR